MRGKVPPHLGGRFADLDALAPAAAPPAPWANVAVVAVGGLTDVGFADSTDSLLVVSSAGRGLVDCRTGSLIARDDDDAPFDRANLLVAGIGLSADCRIRTGGLAGGGLAIRTCDGWSVERHPLSWPDDELFVSPPGQTMLWQPPGEPMQLTKLSGLGAELRAFGFSPTGRSLIIATAADIRIIGR
jgi:hypothetical protein